MRILVVEDNLDILANIVEYLSDHGFSVEGAKDGLTGLHLAITKNYDLIVLDVMLPGMDGNKICHTLRQEGRIETPVIMLTARDTLEDKLQGFNSGADDYLVKPFALAELLVRIQAVVSRSRGGRRNSIQVADLHFDLDTFEVVRQGKFIKINPMCRKLLRILMESSPRIVRREQIEKEMWGESIAGGDNLRTHIHLLRQAVDRPFSKPLIHTVSGMGYRMAELE